MKTSISNTVHSNSRVSSAHDLNTQTAKTDLVINFHMTESCNYKCSYCYATWDDLEAKNELHRLSAQVESLLKKIVVYLLSDNSLKTQMGYENVRLYLEGCGYIVSDSILTAGVEKALSQVPFNVSGFKQRYELIPSVMV